MITNTSKNYAYVAQLQWSDSNQMNLLNAILNLFFLSYDIILSNYDRWKSDAGQRSGGYSLVEIKCIEGSLRQFAWLNYIHNK